MTTGARSPNLRGVMIFKESELRKMKPETLKAFVALGKALDALTPEQWEHLREKAGKHAPKL